MIQKKKLNQFYIEQYERAGRKKPKKPVDVYKRQEDE